MSNTLRATSLLTAPRLLPLLLAVLSGEGGPFIPAFLTQGQGRRLN